MSQVQCKDQTHNLDSECIRSIHYVTAEYKNNFIRFNNYQIFNISLASPTAIWTGHQNIIRQLLWAPMIPTCSNFPVGGNWSIRKKPMHNFRQSVVLYSRSYSELFLSESRKRACSWLLTRAADHVCTHLLYIRPDLLASGLGGHVAKNVSFA